MLFNATRSKPTLPVNFTEQVDFTTAGSNYSTGYRVEKYEFSKSSNSGRNKGEADIVILRLADAYLMRAEAKLRGPKDAAGALADVNIVRAARTATTPAAPLTTMNLDLLFRERGFEFYWEMVRRSDMVRFGKYEGTWTEKSSTDTKKGSSPSPRPPSTPHPIYPAISNRTTATDRHTIVLPTQNCAAWRSFLSPSPHAPPPPPQKILKLYK
ncbi:RagB/SusD family nutrient uptake outer membrane protein [Puia sp. P3]|uniref:RagB/SusD family nutrient uptake outer membrane protein n=1 Tax=Puia sp. P3 TaxID=3423952 RepID=UPI003D677D31